ncbi:MAG: response regulator transcription factor [Planctomycetota bacterium]|jgi:CheY-like chemotaxis protein
MPEEKKPPTAEPAETVPEPSEEIRGRIYEEAVLEAQRHKWIESEKAGHDLGDTAIDDWHCNYWRSWCRERYIEHLHGERFWEELDQGDYGLIQRRSEGDPTLACEIVERIKSGGENLDIIQWATENNHDIDTVLDILKALDINSRRIAPPSEFADLPKAPDLPEEPVTEDRKPRVLIVDDDESTRQLLNEFFTHEGLDVTMAGSGEEAIAAFQKRRFHCYLIDLMLPGKHGAEVAWYLRRHAITVPVIAISALLEMWNEDDLYDCGFTGIMPKPFNLESLRGLANERFMPVVWS